MLIETLSVFPEMFRARDVHLPFLEGRVLAACSTLRQHDLRDWTHDRHRTVDDEPYGGGAGMLMKVEPIYEAISELKSQSGSCPPRVIFFTPCGEPFTQHVAERLAGFERLLFVCGRYEGMDERAYSLADERLSIGDYVLTGGELAAMVVTDAVVRLIPGALGDSMSCVDESFATGEDGGFWSMSSTLGPHPLTAWTSRPSCCPATMLK